MLSKRRYLNYNSHATMSEDEVAARWFFPILIAIVVLAISAGVVGEWGIKDNQHREAVPAQVTMLDADLYLIHDGARVTANDICLNGGADTPAVERNHRIERLNADLAMCYAEQEWNVKAGPARSFIPDGLVHTLTAPWYWSLLGALILLFMPYGYLRALRDESKRAAEERKAERKRLESAKADLIAQWTRASSLELDDPAYISDSDFEARLGELDAKIRIHA